MLSLEDQKWIKELIKNPWYELEKEVLNDEQKSPYDDLISIKVDAPYSLMTIAFT